MLNFPSIARRALISLLAFAVGLPTYGRQITTPPPTLAPVPVASDARMHVITGAEARQHLRTLMSRNPAAFALAEKRLRARGWVPTDQITVIKTPKIKSSDTTTITTDEGEVVFWSWDDGNADTWEGEVWAENYGNGAKQLQETQVDIETDAQVLWEETVFYERPTPVYQEAGRTPRPMSIDGPAEVDTSLFFGPLSTFRSRALHVSTP